MGCTQSKEVYYHCCYCDKSFGSRQACVQHMSIAHMHGQLCYRCCYCGKSLGSRQACVQHMSIAHIQDQGKPPQGKPSPRQAPQGKPVWRNRGEGSRQTLHARPEIPDPPKTDNPHRLPRDWYGWRKTQIETTSTKKWGEEDIQSEEELIASVCMSLV